MRLVIASVLGAIIGLERERKNWSAGMRTHMMLCVGSALIILVSTYGFSDVLHQDGVALDPSRIAAQVVSGIGFLGAGTILFLRPGFIRGLTTASGLWMVAAIGLATGAGMYFAAVATTIIAFSILLILQPLERRLAKLFKYKLVRISLDLKADPTSVLNKINQFKEININSFSFDKNENGYLIEVRLENSNVPAMMPLFMEIEQQPGVIEIFWSM